MVSLLPHISSSTAEEEEENSPLPPYKSWLKVHKDNVGMLWIAKVSNTSSINSTAQEEPNFGHLLPPASTIQESDGGNAVRFYFPFNKQLPNIQQNLHKKRWTSHDMQS